MKKIILFLAFFSILGNSFAQWQYGLRVGGTMMKVEETPEPLGNIYRPGWHAGFFAGYKISKNFTLGAELYYNLKQKSFTEVDTSSLLDVLEFIGIDPEGFGDIAAYVNMDIYSKTQTKANLHFIELPIILSFSPVEALQLNAGVYGAYLFSARSYHLHSDEVPILEATHLLDSFPEAGMIASFFFPRYNNPESEIINSTSPYNTFDAGIIAGLSYKAMHGLWFSFRYTHGFLDFRNKNDGINHSSLQFLVTIPFNQYIVEKKPRLE